MKTWLHILIIGTALMLSLSACGPRAVENNNNPPQVKVPDVPPNPKVADKPIAKLPDVLGIANEVHRDRSPHIMIWVNSELFVDTSLRDNEEVSAEQLGNYLARILFANTNKVSIRADDDHPKKACLRAKFELSLRDRRRALDVLRISFDEMRFSQSLSNPGAWVLTAEGIEIIEKAIPKEE